MSIVFHDGFRKKYRKLIRSEQKKVQQRLRLFIEDPKNPILNNHELIGKYSGYYSINITGDLRALYQIIGKNVTLFITIGTHSHLYE
ncbi:MAG: Addiction module toxin, RelE/StbE family [Parcubacteria group bacterium GW2011_GWB1_40_14]|nr:MAG: Addiction module toxin, RelE/StbE family [Parcubacteria group bacterium GW2011_GWB1_40_14]